MGLTVWPMRQSLAAARLGFYWGDGSLEALLRDILIENPSPNRKATLEAEIKKKKNKFPGTP